MAMNKQHHLVHLLCTSVVLELLCISLSSCPLSSFNENTALEMHWHNFKKKKKQLKLKISV